MMVKIQINPTGKVLYNDKKYVLLKKKKIIRRDKKSAVSPQLQTFPVLQHVLTSKRTFVISVPVLGAK